MLIWFRGLGSWVGWVLMMSLLPAVVSECMVDLVLLVPWFGCGFGGCDLVCWLIWVWDCGFQLFIRWVSCGLMV